MDRKKITMPICFFVIFFMAVVVVVLVNYRNFVQKRDAHYAMLQNELNTAYDVIISFNQETARIAFDTYINQPEILKRYKNANSADKTVRNEVRRQLYKKLLPLYEQLKLRDVRQLHFYLPNSESFLRFHRPEKYGDSLKGVRYSVDKANAERVAVSGFEEGRIFSGFRNVFPLIYNGEHLGSVEISMCFNAIRKRMAQQFHHKYAFMVRRRIVEAKVLPFEQKNYQPGDLSDDYLYERDYTPDDTIKAINAVLKPGIQERLKTGRGFVVEAGGYNAAQLVVFFPVNNVQGQQAAYIVSYNDDSTISHYYSEFIVMLALSIAGIFVIVLLIYLLTDALRRLREEKVRLQQEREQFYRFMNASPSLTFIKDSTFRYIFVNNQLADFFRKSIDDILGKTDLELAEEGEIPPCPSSDKKVLERDTLITVEEKLGDQIYEVIKFPLTLPDGEKGVGGIMNDITGRKQAEEKLKKEKVFSEKIINNANAIIVGLDRKHCIRLFNKGAEKITGYKKDDVMGKDWFELFFPREILNEMNEAWAKAWGTELYPYINAIRCKSGELKIVSWQNTGIYDGDDISEHILISIGEDITGRKELEDSLKKREEQLRTLINSTPDIICFKDGQGRWLEANDANIKLFQLEDVDYRGKKDSELAEYSEFYYDAFMACEESDEVAWQKGALSRRVEIIPRPDGSKKAYDVIKAPLFEEDGSRRGLVVLGRDITEIKKAEEQLRNEREKLFVTLQSIGDGVITTDTEGRITFINGVAEELTGWSPEGASGEPLSKVFNIINEKTGLNCENPVTKVMKSGKIIGLANHTALIARDGTMRSIADSGAPIFDLEGKIVGVVLVFRDVTEEKEREKERLKIEKLESVGVLAGGIAHDFNNILMAILGNINLAEIYVGKDHKAHRLLQQAEKASLRAKDLTRQLLTFSRGGDPVRETASIKQVITESADFVLHGSNVRCRYAFPEDLWLVDIDTGQMSQVIQNLVVNARQAMPEGGEIKISCENVVDITTETALNLQEGKYIKITVADSGCGMPEKYLDKIFDPYFSTKQQGNGLGLAITHSIINKHNGHISVQSKPGEGTTFTIYLPASARQKSRDSGEEAQTPEKAVKGTILVMDDDELIQDSMKEMLTLLGHDEVLPAKDGQEAMAIFKERFHSDKPVDVVIMDLTVPGGMGGKEAIKEILKIDPDARVIVASGYSTDPVMANYRQYGFKAALCKPFKMAQLQETITSILG